MTIIGEVPKILVGVPIQFGLAGLRAGNKLFQGKVGEAAMVAAVDGTFAALSTLPGGELAEGAAAAGRLAKVGKAVKPVFQAVSLGSSAFGVASAANTVISGGTDVPLNGGMPTREDIKEQQAMLGEPETFAGKVTRG